MTEYERKTLLTLQIGVGFLIGNWVGVIVLVVMH